MSLFRDLLGVKTAAALDAIEERAAAAAELRELRETAVTAEARAVASHASNVAANHALTKERRAHAFTLRMLEGTQQERDALAAIVAENCLAEVWPEVDGTELPEALVAALALTEAARDRLEVQAEGFKRERLSYDAQIQALRAALYEATGEGEPTKDIADIGRTSTRYEPVDPARFRESATRVLR